MLSRRELDEIEEMAEDDFSPEAADEISFLVKEYRKLLDKYRDLELDYRKFRESYSREY